MFSSFDASLKEIATICRGRKCSFAHLCINYPSARLASFRYTMVANEDEAFYGVSQKRRIFLRRIENDLGKMAGKGGKDEKERTGLSGISK